MSKGKTSIQGIYPVWRKGKKFDAFRVSIRKANESQVQISAKIQPTLRQINSFLKAKEYDQAKAEQDNDFQALKHRLFQELQSEHSLKIYKIQEKLDLKRKEFDFGRSIDEFESYKRGKHSNSYSTKQWLVNFWMPFFLDKGCQHPRDFINWRLEAETHIQTALTRSGKKYSFNSYATLAGPLNTYMKYLLAKRYIGQEAFFTIDVKMTLEQRKQQNRKGRRVQAVRTHDVYSEKDLFKIKENIDEVYKDKPDLKIRAYALYFGVATGLRRGNLLGMTADCLHPDAKVPYFEVKDNIVAGWSRGEKGSIIFEETTKMTSGETIKLPFIQPSKDVLIEVAKFLKQNIDAHERLLDCSPDTVAKWWRKICKDCGIRFIHPHGWKHGYATVGAMHLHDWYKGNPYYLQRCCLHSSFRTTEKYIRQVSNQFLEAFEG